MMRALILSSRCTAEQRLALMELRAFLEEYGDTCEMLDWLSFLSDTVSEINTHSRTLVRRHIQELLAGAFQSNSRKEEEPKEKGVRRLIEISVKELARFICEGDYELVVCAEPGAAETPAIIRKIREQYPSVPIIASGGNTSESIRETIRAGANAVTYTPPITKEIFRVTMSKYRES